MNLQEPSPKFLPMTQPTILTDAFSNFDGRSTEDLKEAALLVIDTVTATELLNACNSNDSTLQDAATWVVKYLIETGKAEHLDLFAVFEALDHVSDWPAQLHILQSIQYAPDLAVDRVAIVRKLMASPKTLVRVWATDAFVRLAIERTELLPEARDKVLAGLEGKAGSMRSRCRHLQVLLTDDPA